MPYANYKGKWTVSLLSIPERLRARFPLTKFGCYTLVRAYINEFKLSPLQRETRDDIPHVVDAAVLNSGNRYYTVTNTSKISCNL